MMISRKSEKLMDKQIHICKFQTKQDQTRHDPSFFDPNFILSSSSFSGKLVFSKLDVVPPLLIGVTVYTSVTAVTLP